MVSTLEAAVVVLAVVEESVAGAAFSGIVSRFEPPVPAGADDDAPPVAVCLARSSSIDIRRA